MTDPLAITKLNEWKACEGRFLQYSHVSDATATPMRFTVFLPPQAEKGPVPVRHASPLLA